MTWHSEGNMSEVKGDLLRIEMLRNIGLKPKLVFQEFTTVALQLQFTTANARHTIPTPSYFCSPRSSPPPSLFALSSPGDPTIRGLPSTAPGAGWGSGRATGRHSWSDQSFGTRTPRWCWRGWARALGSRVPWICARRVGLWSPGKRLFYISPIDVKTANCNFLEYIIWHIELILKAINQQNKSIYFLLSWVIQLSNYYTQLKKTSNCIVMKAIN